MVEVVSPEPRDPFYVFKLFDSVLEHPVEGGEANEGERRQQYQAKGIERRADAGQRWRIMSYPLVFRLVISMSLFPDASYCQALSRLAGS